MKENGICEQTHYLWQRRIRWEVFEQISSAPELPVAVAEKEEITFEKFRWRQQIMHLKCILLHRAYIQLQSLKQKTSPFPCRMIYLTS